MPDKPLNARGSDRDTADGGFRVSVKTEGDLPNGVPDSPSVCDACGKKRKLAAIDSGQFLCRACRTEFGPVPSTRPATENQLAFARSVGFHFNDDVLFATVSLALDQMTELTYYIADVWESEIGARPKDCGVQWSLIQRFAVMFMRSHTETAARILVQMAARDEVAYARAEKQSLGMWPPAEMKSLRELKPPVIRDADFALVARLIREEWSDSIPTGQRGWLSRLLS